MGTNGSRPRNPVVPHKLHTIEYSRIHHKPIEGPASFLPDCLKSHCWRCVDVFCFTNSSVCSLPACLLSEDYVLTEKVLGSGFSGPVRMAACRATGKKYAVKPFNKKGATKERLDLLRNEAEIYLRLDHPHIAKLIDIFEDSAHVWIVMEHCSGRELYQRLDEKKVYKEADAAHVTFQMLEAVQYLHSHDVVHRDLKLENWLYEDEREDARLKLIDFGFSKIWNPFTSQRMHATCGSLAYVSPDTLTGSYTNACDMWSLGVIVYMLLVGYPPFYGSEAQILSRISRAHYSMSGSRWRKVSEKAKDFVRLCLEKDPNKRLTATQALIHPWIMERVHLPEVPIDTAVLGSLRSYCTSTHLRRAALTMMAFSLTTKEIAELADLFLAFDHDRSGRISLTDFVSVMKEHFDISTEEIEKIFLSLSERHSSASAHGESPQGQRRRLRKIFGSGTSLVTSGEGDDRERGGDGRVRSPAISPSPSAPSPRVHDMWGRRDHNHHGQQHAGGAMSASACGGGHQNHLNPHNQNQWGGGGAGAGRDSGGSAGLSPYTGGGGPSGQGRMHSNESAGSSGGPSEPFTPWPVREEQELEICYSDFVAAMLQTRVKLHEGLVREAFRRFDIDHSGYISTENLRHVLGPVFEGEDMDELIREVDTNGDGRIDYQEFLAAVLRPDPTMDAPPLTQPSDFSSSSSLPNGRGGMRHVGTATTLANSLRGSGSLGRLAEEPEKELMAAEGHLESRQHQQENGSKEPVPVPVHPRPIAPSGPSPNQHVDPGMRVELVSPHGQGKTLVEAPPCGDRSKAAESGGAPVLVPMAEAAAASSVAAPDPHSQRHGGTEAPKGSESLTRKGWEAQRPPMVKLSVTTNRDRKVLSVESNPDLSPSAGPVGATGAVPCKKFSARKWKGLAGVVDDEIDKQARHGTMIERHLSNPNVVRKLSLPPGAMQRKTNPGGGSTQQAASRAAAGVGGGMGGNVPVSEASGVSTGLPGDRVKPQVPVGDQAPVPL
uniref:Calmodulin n=1 Tax=Chromera velia CCMP2878 TaxID=1169474 RepID=A0A0G4HDH8_9ALVE|eukprot:Cvel_26383.t1-p1 / transcript=Cvel_26383.t1 / gene=Cvel_26383 / organism=Chromera_velia_CCMP2878 / gene_product=Calcium-dependent protein kinase 2, putative / transcript_product=Calcium-dependent protein kinase 2, putative / location=Cvel_scaffold3128:3046-12290(+) / protein_length=999 / sequence_SO=supercontig / SO=protein_coding / is_pseudo=false